MLAVYPIGMGVILLTIVVDQSHLVVAHEPALYQLSGLAMWLPGAWREGSGKLVDIHPVLMLAICLTAETMRNILHDLYSWKEASVSSCPLLSNHRGEGLHIHPSQYVSLANSYWRS